jgi:retron-type reverse transcriptase
MKLIEFLSETLLIEEDDIKSFSATAPYRYKKYFIKKRNGKGLRLIAHPSKQLKFIQKVLLNEIESSFVIHESAFAYKKGVGIKDNALVHVNSKYLLKMDFKDFFPSITPDLLFYTLKKFKYEIGKTDKELLSRLLFFRVKRERALILSIGAPSSPFISNLVMYFFDEAVKSFCDTKKINYTRYADDITFSSNVKGVLFDVPNFVKTALEVNCNGKILINHEKTIYSSKAHNRHVTGVTITNDDKISIGRDRKRLISSMVHKYMHNLLDASAVSKLEGLLSFANDVEPNFINRLYGKYGDEVLTKIIRRKP